MGGGGGHLRPSLQPGFSGRTGRLEKNRKRFLLCRLGLGGRGGGGSDTCTPRTCVSLTKWAVAQLSLLTRLQCHSLKTKGTSRPGTPLLTLHVRPRRERRVAQKQLPVSLRAEDPSPVRSVQLRSADMQEMLRSCWLAWMPEMVRKLSPFLPGTTGPDRPTLPRRSRSNAHQPRPGKGTHTCRDRSRPHPRL